MLGPHRCIKPVLFLINVYYQHDEVIRPLFFPAFRLDSLPRSFLICFLQAGSSDSQPFDKLRTAIAIGMAGLGGETKR